MRFRFPMIILLVVLAGTALWSPAQAVDPVSMRVGMLPAASLDPVNLRPDDTSGRDLVENLFIGLVRFDPVTRSLQPGLAKSWTMSEDGLTWTFTLRTDIQWVRYNTTTNAVEAVRPVVAGDVTYGIRRACDPNPPNPVAKSVYIIAGCRTIATANPLLVDDIFIANNLGARVISPTQVEIKILFPAAYFPVLLTLPEFRPVPREAIAQSAQWADGTGLVSDGPWVLSSRDSSGLSLVRNTLWPDAPTGNVERVQVTFGQTTADLAAQYNGDQSDFVRLDPTSVGTITAPDKHPLVSVPGGSVTVLGFSTERLIVTDVNVRRALSFAVDRATLIPAGQGIPMGRLTPAQIAIGGFAKLPDDDNLGFDAAAAKTALAASKAANCRVTEKLEFAVENTPAMIAVANALLANWSKNLGCNPQNFKIQPITSLALERIAHGTFSTIRSTDGQRPHLWLYTWTPDDRDMAAWAGDGVHCRFGFLQTNVPCGDADAALDLATSANNAATRLDALNRAETLYFGPQGTFPVVPLFGSISVAGVVPALQGVSVDSPLRFDQWVFKRP